MSGLFDFDALVKYLHDWHFGRLIVHRSGRHGVRQLALYLQFCQKETANAIEIFWISSALLS
jgi:hypothetical protein